MRSDRDRARPTADRMTFDLIAKGLTTLIGFGIAVINIVDGDDLVVAAVAGVEEAIRSDGTIETADDIVGTRFPVALVQAQLDIADDWGRFKFVPHDRRDPGPDFGWTVPTPADEPADPDAWHPMDSLFAPVYGPDGRLCGAVTLDDPLDGRRPTPAHLRLMDKYVDLVGRAITTTLEHERLAEQVRLLDTARVVVRRATAQRSMRAVLAETGETMRQAFGAAALWIRILETGDDVEEYVQYFSDEPLRRDLRLSMIATRTARKLWEDDELGVVDVRAPSRPIVSQEDDDYVRGYLQRQGYSALLYVPLGAGPECLGAISIMRAADARPFTQVERNAVRDIGLDLGRMLLSTRNLERERRLVRQLRDLDAFKTGLIARVADELSTPLAAIVADAAPLHRIASPDHDMVSRLLANARRMARMADDLLVLARTEEQDATVTGTRLDFAAVVSAVVGHLEPTAPPRVRAVVPSYAVMVAGDPAELEQVVSALLANARAYTPGSGEVDVRLREVRDTVQLTVTDTGIGIASPDLGRVFDEFFRSSDPRVRSHPGAGLGLTVVDRIVHRHGGWVTVRSVPEQGTTFTVVLPRAT